jgi:hypothetical protein
VFLAFFQRSQQKDHIAIRREKEVERAGRRLLQFIEIMGQSRLRFSLKTKTELVP